MLLDSFSKSATKNTAGLLLSLRLID